MSIKRWIFSLLGIFVFVFGAVIFSQTTRSEEVQFRAGFQNDTGEVLTLDMDRSQCFDRAATIVPKTLSLGRVNLGDLTAKAGCEDPEIHLMIYSKQGSGKVPVGQVFYNASEGSPFSIYQVNNPDYEMSAVLESGRFVIKIKRKTKF